MVLKIQNIQIALRYHKTTSLYCTKVELTQNDFIPHFHYNFIKSPNAVEISLGIEQAVAIAKVQKACIL